MSSKDRMFEASGMERNFHVMFPPSKPTVDGRNPAPVHYTTIYRVSYISGGAGFQPVVQDFSHQQ